jgi:hypothetical protein
MRVERRTVTLSKVKALEIANYLHMVTVDRVMSFHDPKKRGGLPRGIRAEIACVNKWIDLLGGTV